MEANSVTIESRIREARDKAAFEGDKFSIQESRWANAGNQRRAPEG